MAGKGPLAGQTSGEFHISIKGLKLSREATDRIARAVQRAVMVEVAGLDLAPKLGLRLTGDGGGTQGIEVVAES